RDAEWELEPNAFSDLYERRIHCDAPVCKCPEGRKLDDLGSRWEILLCDLCGTTGVHIVCGRLPFTCTKWNCSSCMDMLYESSRRLKLEERERRLAERKDRTSVGVNKSRGGGRQNLNVTIAESNPSRTVATSPNVDKRRRGGRPFKRGGGRGRQSLNVTISDNRPSGRRGRQSLNVTISDNRPSRTVITTPPKRRRSSEPLVIPRKIPRIENTPIKEAKRALLTPNKEPVVELERIKIPHISETEEIDIEVEDKVSLSGVSRSLTKLMECETTISSSDMANREETSGANKGDKSVNNGDINSSDTPKTSDVEIKNVNKEKDTGEDISSISIMENEPIINDTSPGLSPDDNIRTIEESGGELPEPAIELKNYALLAQGIMNELRLTETEVIALASSSAHIKENFAKSDIARFFRYNLSIKKMMEIKEILEYAFAERKAIIKTAHDKAHKRKPKPVSPTISKDIRAFGSPIKASFKDLNSQSDFTPTKGKDVKSANLNLDSNDNIDISSSVSTKDDHILLVKRSNKFNSVGESLDYDKSKSSTLSDIQNSGKRSEELDPKTSEIEETATEPAKTVEKVECIMVKLQETQNPDKSLKGSLNIHRKYPRSVDISVYQKNIIPRKENKYWKPFVQQETVWNIAPFTPLMQNENFISNREHSDDLFNGNNKNYKCDNHNTQTLQWNIKHNHFKEKNGNNMMDRNKPHHLYSSLSDLQYVQKSKPFDLRHIINDVKFNRTSSNSEQKRDVGHILEVETFDNISRLSDLQYVQRYKQFDLRHIINDVKLDRIIYNSEHQSNIGSFMKNNI
ncbi:unnamed protein product, partial [Meganyctiphanes norvegica]